MTEKPSQLSSAARFPVLSKYIGQVCLVAAALNMVPMAVALAVAEMGLPEDIRVVCYYRGDKFLLPSDDTTFPHPSKYTIDPICFARYHETMYNDKR
jgi:hypothetical protein